MLNVKFARFTFQITDVLGMFGLGIGVLIFLADAFSKGHQPIPGVLGIYLAVSGFSCFIVSHIGRGIVDISETNKEILEHLKRR